MQGTGCVLSDNPIHPQLLQVDGGTRIYLPRRPCSMTWNSAQAVTCVSCMCAFVPVGENHGGGGGRGAGKLGCLVHRAVIVRDVMHEAGLQVVLEHLTQRRLAACVVDVHFACTTQ